MLLMPTLVIGHRLLGVIERIRSVQEPFLRNLLEKVANGPNMIAGVPSRMRLSMCGTDIGGEPAGARP